MRAPPPALVSRMANQSSCFQVPALLPGLFVVEDFVSEAEEAALVDWVDQAPWTRVLVSLAPHSIRGAVGSKPSEGADPGAWEVSRWNSPGAGNEGKAWGAQTRSGVDGRLCVPRFEPLPWPLLALAERIALVASAVTASVPGDGGGFQGGAWRPNQANAISYTRAQGHYLGAHCDDRQLSGDSLCTLSLGCGAVMTYSRDGKQKGSGNRVGGADPERHRVRLPRRSLQLQTGEVRFKYRHGIANQDLDGPRRVSITFRKERTSKAS